MIRLKRIGMFILMISCMLAVAGLLYGCGDQSGEAGEEAALQQSQEDSTDMQMQDTQPAQESAPASSDAFVMYKMWDYVDLGSGANDDDPNHERIWTLYYDGSSKNYSRLLEEEDFTISDGGYTVSDVESYVSRLKDEVFRQMPFVSVTATQYGDTYVVQSDYTQLDNKENRIALANAGLLCMQADWGDTVDSAEEVIQQLHGEFVLASIADENDAVEYAKKFAKKQGLVDDIDSIVVECDQVTEEGYKIHGYEDLPDHTATLFWWTISEDGIIHDDVMNQRVN